MRGNSIQRDLDEIKQLAIRYIKEETIQPLEGPGSLRRLGRARQPAGGLRLLLLALRRLAIPPRTVPGPRRHALVDSVPDRGGAGGDHHRPHALADRERHREATTQGPEVREQSATRQQLEASIRALLPSEEEIDEMTPSKNSDGVDGRRRGHHDRLRLGPLPGSSGTQEEGVLILKRVFGLATASALAKAWEKKSLEVALARRRRWCSFSFFDSRAARKPSPKKVDQMSAAELKLGERVMLIDAKDRHYLITLREGAEFHTHAGHRPAQRRHRHPRRLADSRQHRAQFPGASPDAVRRGVEDAAWRAGDLPEGPRDDSHAGRRGAGDARARGRRRFRRALDDVAARRRPDHRLRDPRGLRAAGDQERARHARHRRRLRRADPRRDDGHRRDRPRPRSSSTCPNRGTW